jgi:hypothetical protein
MTKTLPLALALFVPAVADAAPARDPNGHPWTLNVGVGPTVNLEGAGALGKLGLDFQYHFKRGDVGPALGASFYTHFRAHVFGFQLGPLFSWDFRVHRKDKLALYLAPLVGLGYSLTGYPGSYYGGTDSQFFMDFGGQFKAVFRDRVGFFVRPANFSLLAGRGGATGFWTLLTGLTISF